MSKIEQIITEIEEYIDNCKFQPLSTLNNGDFKLLFSTPTINSSTILADLLITSKCPFVTGSKLPG